ncbi:unnamed protein product [Nippostrongylus brasiliensis]|uniref:Lipoprotein n=1 Tax=Nippostrongylus brasiliensis TaxID=27835 RepID=A0A0N4YYZ7_NIPBR|nr:unnamed protein product [Nippostrongylus brasiliensis]
MDLATAQMARMRKTVHIPVVRLINGNATSTNGTVSPVLLSTNDATTSPTVLMDPTRRIVLQIR